MRIQPTITFEQYRDAVAAVVAAKGEKVTLWSWKGNTALAVICLVLGIASLSQVARVPIFTFYALLILCWVLLKPYVRWSQAKCLRAVYSEEQEKLNGQVFTIDEAGISCDQVNGQATSHYKWQAFIKRIDLPDAFLFLPSPNSFVRVPKEDLGLPDRELIWRWSSAVPTVGNG